MDVEPNTRQMKKPSNNQSDFLVSSDNHRFSVFHQTKKSHKLICIEKKLRKSIIYIYIKYSFKIYFKIFNYLINT